MFFCFHYLHTRCNACPTINDEFNILYDIGDSVDYVGYIIPMALYIFHALISSDQNFTHCLVTEHIFAHLSLTQHMCFVVPHLSNKIQHNMIFSKQLKIFYKNSYMNSTLKAHQRY